MKLKKLFLNTAGAIALAGLAVSAQAEFLEFTIDEGSVPGTAARIVVADKLNGGYSERITIHDDLSIDFTGVVRFTGIFTDQGANPAFGSGLNSTYGMYAIFQGSGTFNPAAGRFSIDTAGLAVYIDPTGDTTFTYGEEGKDGVTRGNADDDYNIAFAFDLMLGSGIAGTPGAFQAVWQDFLLTDEGEAYFIEPRPFHLIVEATGDFDADTFEFGTFDLTGDVSAVFLPVPEPSSVALMGLALLGLGVAARRRMVS